MTLTIDISIEDEKWLSELEDYEPLINSICRNVLSHTKIIGKSDEIEISVVLANDEFIKELNNDYRGKDKATNVLSFPSEELTPFEYDELPDYLVLGDIILAIETIKKEAAEQEKSVHDHFCHLITHGLLHLLGFDHIEDDDAEEMESAETDILAKMNIDSPY